MAEMRMGNAREPDQLARMKKLEDLGLCFYCADNYLVVDAKAPLMESRHWYVKESDYPYPGALQHFLLVPNKRHVTCLADLTSEELGDIQQGIAWLKAYTGSPGESLFARSGDMAHTGATLDHLHFHYLVGLPEGEGTEPIRVKLGFKATNPVE